MNTGELSYMAIKTCWRSVHFDSLRIHEWEDGFAIFQPDSGRTHFLNPLGMQILADIAASEVAITEAEIVANLSARSQLDVDTGISGYVQKTVQRLDELGLVEKSPGSCDSES
jgi:PqqD family protein of HPr-rel-A system